MVLFSKQSPPWHAKYCGITLIVHSTKLQTVRKRCNFSIYMHSHQNHARIAATRKLGFVYSNAENNFTCLLRLFIMHG